MPCENIKKGFNHSVISLSHNNFLNLTINERRKFLRDQLVEVFKAEEPGTGKQEQSTRHVYCVATTMNNKNKVYLARPATLNYGFDFTVNSSNILFFAPTKNNPMRTTKTPRHDSLIHPLDFLQINNKKIFDILLQAIEEVFLCIDMSIIENNYSSIFNYTFQYFPVDGVSLTIDIKTILHTIEWLFMEQDITYWSYTGRYMLYKGLSGRYDALPEYLPE